MIKFSVIIPTYNRASTISNTIKSVLQQTFASFEIIIVDDGSTDNTKQIVELFDDKRIYYYYKNNEERAAARNYGAKKSNGKFLTFLDSDDIFYANHLETADILIENNPKNVFFHLNYEIKTTNKFVRLADFDEKSPLFLAKGNPLSCLGVFVERITFLENQFNETRNLSGSEDWELWLRLYAKFGLVRDKHITACLNDHSDRSVLNYNEEQLLNRKNLAIKSAFLNTDVQKIFKPYYKIIDSYTDTYISLHLVLSKKKFLGIKYLFLAFLKYPPSIFYIRSLAIFKHLLLS